MNNVLSLQKQQEIEKLQIIPITNTRIDNLTGKQFNRLTVIGQAPKPNNTQTRAYWWCICSCKQHNIIRTSGKSLKNGNTKSCGCLQKEKASINARIRNTTIFPGQGNKKDLTNMTFGYLQPLEATEQRGIDGSIIWKCKCIKDNNIIFVASHLLLNGSVQSCGCLQSKGENRIEQLLIEHNIYYIKQFHFSDLYDKSPLYPLKFDFAIIDDKNELLYLIQYDGIQHFKETYYSRDNYQKRLYRDELKNNYCKKHNIPLIRIPYTKYNTLSIEDIILK